MRSVPTVLLIALVVVTAGCSTPTVGLQPRATWLDIDGDFEISAGRDVVRGSSSSSALGLEREIAFEPRIHVDFDDFHIALAAFAADYSGDGTAQAALQLRDVTIAAEAKVRSRLDLMTVTGDVVYDILDLGPVSIGPGIGVGVGAYEMSFREPGTGLKVESDDSLPFAYLTLRVAADLGPVEIIVRASGISVEFQSNDVQYLNLDLGAKIDLFGDEESVEGLALLGWRYYGLEYEYEDGNSDVDVDVSLSGPYLGFEIRF